MSEDIKCHECQTNLVAPYFENEKEKYNVCQSCLEELDKRGELWDNFFIKIISSGGREGGFICGYCHEAMLERQTHQEENDKMTIKHNCQAKCNGSMGITECKTFSLTQSYADWMKKYGYKSYPPMCLDCRTKKVKGDINWTNDNLEKSKKQEALKELENIVSGKQEREREREQNWSLRLQI